MAARKVGRQIPILFWFPLLLFLAASGVGGGDFMPIEANVGFVVSALILVGDVKRGGESDTKLAFLVPK